MAALQEATEGYLVGWFEGGFCRASHAKGRLLTVHIDCNLNAIHAKRVTLQAKDSHLAQHYYRKFGMRMGDNIPKAT